MNNVYPSFIEEYVKTRLAGVSQRELELFEKGCAVCGKTPVIMQITKVVGQEEDEIRYACHEHERVETNGATNE